MLDLIIEDGAKPLSFDVRFQLNGGFSSRDQAKAQEHFEELKKEGINIAVSETPIFIPKLRDRNTTSNTIEVLASNKSCGEAEPVLIFTKDDVYVTIGSDHSDRDLEKYDLIVSKQMCPNVMCNKVWRYKDVEDYWDDLVLKAWTVEASGKKELYQDAKLSSFMTVDDFLKKSKEHIKCDLAGGLLFMGTAPTLAGQLVFTPGFEAQLIDEKRGRKLTCSYTIEPMTWFK